MNARNGCYDLFVCSPQGEVKGKTKINRKNKERERKRMKGRIQKELLKYAKWLM